MTIKNWTVTAESTQSAAAREIYFFNKKVSSHKHTTDYVSVIGSRQTAININANLERYKLEQAVKRRGGRPPTGAMEFVFTLPKREDLQPTKEQWKKMIVAVVNDMARSMKINPSDLNGIVRAVVHRQDQELKGGSGDHCHVMIGKFTNDCKYLRELQKKGVLYAAKQSFNVAVREVMGVDYTTYRAEQSFNSKKRAPLWKVRAARQREEVEAMHTDLAKFMGQGEKWLKAFDESDQKQMNRQLNRMKKSAEKIDTFALPDDQKEVFAEMIKLVNAKTDKPLTIGGMELPTTAELKTQPKRSGGGDCKPRKMS